MNKKSNILYFLVGLGSQLQIVASLSMTETFVFMAAPVLFFSEIPYMRRHGLMPLFWLSIWVVIGCAIACVDNHTIFDFALRGMATACLLPCCIVVGHWLLRKNMNGFKWLLLGIAFSELLCTFLFQRSVEVVTAAQSVVGAAGGAVGAADIAQSPLFWISRMGAIFFAPTKGWYLDCPILYSVGVPFCLAVFAMMTTTSGRSAALGALGTVALVLIGGKTQSGMKRIGRHFWLLAFLAIFGAFAAKGAYRIAATSGWLGEKALAKYENQTKGNKGMMALLLGGRMESFAGLLACVDKPIVGFGPWPIDNNGYTEEFLRRFGNVEDYEKYLSIKAYYQSLGNWRASLIPGHSYITGFWLVNGIGGLVFWIYVLFVLLRHLRQDCWAVPQWFMWLACGIPGLLWNIFFSPFADRFGTMLYLVAILITRAVRKGVFPMPQEMIREIWKAENKR